MMIKVFIIHTLPCTHGEIITCRPLLPRFFFIFLLSFFFLFFFFASRYASASSSYHPLSPSFLHVADHSLPSISFNSFLLYSFPFTALCFSLWQSLYVCILFRTHCRHVRSLSVFLFPVYKDFISAAFYFIFPKLYHSSIYLYSLFTFTSSVIRHLCYFSLRIRRCHCLPLFPSLLSWPD